MQRTWQELGLKIFNTPCSPQGEGGGYIHTVSLWAIIAAMPGDELNLSKNQQQIYQKSTKNLSPRPSWRALGGSWAALGGLLGASWRALGAILAHLSPKIQHKLEKCIRVPPLTPQCWDRKSSNTPIEPPMLGPKIYQIPT